MSSWGKTPDRPRIKPPSRWVRWAAPFGPVIAVLFLLCALGSAAGLLYNVTTMVDIFQLVVSVVLNGAMTVVFAVMAYRVGITLPRAMREWDAAVRERAQLLRP